MKTVMILGAGIYQVPLIRKAKEMGFRTVVVSIDGNYPGFALADSVRKINTTDKEAVLAAAREDKISGIATCGTDVAVASIGYVAEKLHLPGIPLSAAKILTDKAEMKKAFEGSVPTPRHVTVRTLAEACAAAEEIGYPVMIKACDSSGSRGVTRVTGPDEAEAAYAASRAVTRTDHVIVEKAVSGTEIGLDAFIENGKAQLILPHTKFVCRAGAVTIPAGHAFPYTASETVLRKLRDAVDGIVRSTGADHCALNCDIMVDGEEVNVLEAGGRCGATCIPELIERHTGIDFYAQILRSATGEVCDFTVRHHAPAMAKLLFAEKSGVVRAVDREKIRAVAAATGAEIGLDVTEGDSVRSPRNGTDRIGQVIMDTASEMELDAVLSAVREAVRVEI